MISLCIPTMNRFDSFLSYSLQQYVKYLQDGLIEEIHICDENGNDYDKIMALYKDIPRFHVYKNDTVLGVFKNKMKVCSKATCEYVALIDSDNFCDASYFIKAKEYITNTSCQNCIIAPSFAKPQFDYTFFNNSIITKKNLKQYFHVNNFQTFLNTGNYIIHRNLLNIVHDDSISLQISACDVLYFNLLMFQQMDGFEIHIVENLHYTHVVHNGSTYLNTVNHCRSCIDSYVMPSYIELINSFEQD